jgi:streptogramin lyase
MSLEFFNLKKFCKFFFFSLVFLILLNCSGGGSNSNSCVTTIAGKVGLFGSADGIGAVARFNAPFGVVTDPEGNLFISDWGNQTIRKISYSGVVSTFAGEVGVPGFTNSFRLSARFNNPRGLAIDNERNLYIADEGNNVIRKVLLSGQVITLAGREGEVGYLDGDGTQALFNNPRGIALDSVGSIYIADQGNNLIRKISQNGFVSTYAGKAGEVGHMDGDLKAARFRSPEGIAVDKLDNIFIADSGNHTIRKISSDGLSIITFAGIASQIGIVDGFRDSIRLNSPRGIAIDNNNNIIVADSLNQTLRLISKEGESKTLAGIPLEAGWEDGLSSNAKFNFPRGVTVDASGNIYVVDQSNQIIRKINNLCN